MMIPISLWRVLTHILISYAHVCTQAHVRHTCANAQQESCPTLPQNRSDDVVPLEDRYEAIAGKVQHSAAQAMGVE